MKGIRHITIEILRKYWPSDHITTHINKGDLPVNVQLLCFWSHHGHWSIGHRRRAAGGKGGDDDDGDDQQRWRVTLMMDIGDDVQGDGRVMAVGGDVGRWSGMSGREWLSRAAETSPLSITVLCTRQLANSLHAEANLGVFSTFMDVTVSKNSARTKHLELTLPPVTLGSLYTLPDSAFPRLQSLSLHPYVFVSDLVDERDNSSWQWPISAPAFQNACLRAAEFTPAFPATSMAAITNLIDDDTVATVEAIFAGFDDGAVGSEAAQRILRATSVSLPWKGLRKLEFPFTMCPVNVWCEALAECPQIEVCMVAVSPGGSERLPGSEIRLEHLQFIYLVTLDGAGEVLLRSLVAPTLKTCGVQGHVAVNALLDFQTRSGFNLDVLIMVFRLPEDDIYPLLHGLPTLGALGVILASTEHFPDDVWTQIALGENWELCETDKERIALQVFFKGLHPNDVNALKEGLEPLEKYSESGKRIASISPFNLPPLVNHVPAHPNSPQMKNAAARNAIARPVERAATACPRGFPSTSSSSGSAQERGCQVWRPGAEDFAQKSEDFEFSVGGVGRERECK
ncbi:hypothetical protein C8F01DRAFT_1077738 [Mycena amicta]|nr:hypothetical protein C8F01DRAFT_1077738 [Mycena amicta]